jgi:hypothetical protein
MTETVKHKKKKESWNCPSCNTYKIVIYEFPNDIEAPIRYEGEYNSLTDTAYCVQKYLQSVADQFHSISSCHLTAMPYTIPIVVADIMSSRTNLITKNNSVLYYLNGITFPKGSDAESPSTSCGSGCPFTFGYVYISNIPCMCCCIRTTTNSIEIPV